MIWRKFACRITIQLALLAAAANLPAAEGRNLNRPHPANNPQSALMLQGEWAPEQTHRIDFAKLPRVPSGS